MLRDLFWLGNTNLSTSLSSYFEFRFSLLSYAVLPFIRFQLSCEKGVKYRYMFIEFFVFDWDSFIDFLCFSGWVLLGL